MGQLLATLFSPPPDHLRLEEVITRGKYGEVVRGTLGRRPVAVKKFNGLLLDSITRGNGRNMEASASAFRKEYEILITANIPHMVELLGVYRDPTEGGCVLLVMEWMYQTLENYLEVNKNTLSRQKKMNICYKASRGLCFLHQHNPQILHCNLSAKNILLNEDGSMVKISDLGQAKHHPSITHYLSTKAPGCVPYMPPECLGDHPHFTDKGDTFSFGVVMLQVSTQEPPSCGLDNIQAKPETERRARDLAKLSNFHALKPLIVLSLNSPYLRPDAEVIRDTLGFLVDNPLRVGSVISRGAYGEVSRGSLGSRPVAVKKIHQILLDAAAESEQALEAVLLAFRRECEILRSAKNPHIVEFLGVFEEEAPGKGEVLVMELMNQTLEKFLKDHKGSVSLGKQLDIWYQVSCGLLFLHQHSPQILHRDVTAKNILLNEDGSVVKISDLGQAKFRPSTIQYLSTKAPGCVPYMPPECLGDHPHFTDKGDTFSFGVVMLQVSTQEPPSCGLDNIQAKPETERRARDLAKLSDSHPLKPLIIRCLHDDPRCRPDMSEVRQLFRNAGFEGHVKLAAEVAKNEQCFRTDSLLEGNAALHSIRLQNLPLPTADASVVRIESTVYVSGGACCDIESARYVQAYNLDAARWTTLPPAPVYNSESTVIHGQLTLIGGFDVSTKKVTNRICTWVEDPGEWRQTIPPMSTARLRPCVVQSGNAVAVLGGGAKDDITALSSVDVLNTATLQWTASHFLALPIPMYGLKAAICDGYVYVLSPYHLVQKAWKLPLSILEQSIVDQLHNSQQKCHWVEVEHTPFFRSGLLPTSRNPLIVNGSDAFYSLLSAIEVSSQNKWSRVGCCDPACIRPCLLAVSCSSFLVLGGCIDPQNASASLLTNVVLYYL